MNNENGPSIQGSTEREKRADNNKFVYVLCCDVDGHKHRAKKIDLFYVKNLIAQ